jgi:hypothetical protein
MKGSKVAVKRKPAVAHVHSVPASCPMYRGKIRLPEPKNMENRAIPITNTDGSFALDIHFLCRHFSKIEMEGHKSCRFWR